MPRDPDEGLLLSKRRSRRLGARGDDSPKLGQPERIRDDAYLRFARHMACEHRGAADGAQAPQQPRRR